MSRLLKIQFMVLSILIFLGFVPYAFNYFQFAINGTLTYHDNLRIILPSILITLAAFVIFILSIILFFKQKKVGYYLYLLFAVLDFIYYFKYASAGVASFIRDIIDPLPKGIFTIEVATPLTVKIAEGMWYLSWLAAGFTVILLVFNYRKLMKIFK